MHNEPVGGLVGGAVAVGSAAANTARKAYTVFANPDAWALRLVLFAGVITIIKKNYVPGEPYSYAMWFGISLGVAALMFEMSAIKKAISAWWHGRLGAAAWSFAIWGVAFSFSLNQWLGAASENQVEKTNFHATEYVQSETARKTVAEAEAKKAMLEARLEALTSGKGAGSGWVSTQPVAAWQAEIGNMEGDRVYKRSKQCSNVTIAESRAFCDKLKDLRANLAAAIDMEKVQDQIAATEAALEKGRAVASETKVVNTQVRGDLLIPVKYFGLSEETAGVLNGLFSIVAISLFLSYISAMKQIDLERELGPRKRVNLMLRLKCWLSRVLYARNPKGVQIIESHTTVDRTDDSWKRHLTEAADGFRIPAIGAAA